MLSKWGRPVLRSALTTERVNKVLHAGRLGRAGKGLSLTDFRVAAGFHEVLDRESAPGAFQGVSHRSWIIQVAPEYFGARQGQGSGGRLGGIPGQGPDGEARMFQEMPCHGAALLAGGAGNQYRLVVHYMNPFTFLAVVR